MIIKNQALTGYGFTLVDKTTGDPITSGTVTVYVTKDGGVQAVAAGTPVHEGNGQWTINFTATEMNGDVIAVLATHVDAVNYNDTLYPVTVAGPVSEDDIVERANTPKSVRTDEGRVEERSIDELIKADQYAATKTAQGATPWGLKVAKTKPGGTTTS